jgi:hypothetical protein
MGWYDRSNAEMLRLTAKRLIEVAELSDLLDEKGVECDFYVPEYYTEFTQNCTVNEGWDSTTQSYKVDREASLAKIAEITAALPGKKEKVMDEDGLKVTFTTESGATLEFHTDKKVTCSPKVVGQKWVEPYVPAPREGHYEDIVEWECDEVVLLKHKATAE